MSQAAHSPNANPAVASVIDDVCWELFDGPCGVHASKEQMASCPRKIRECDVFVPAFRAASSLLRASKAQPAPQAQPHSPAPPVEHKAPGEHAAPGDKPPQ